MGALVKQEVDVLMERLAGEMDTDEAMTLIEVGTQPLNDLLAAMHTKALVAELERRRGAEPDSNGGDSDGSGWAVVSRSPWSGPIALRVFRPPSWRGVVSQPSPRCAFDESGRAGHRK